jgi:N6-L-threonylcarbamoyladenine synthase
VVEQALADAGADRSSIDAIAVTNAPGLVGALLVGVSFAKSLAWSLGIPVLGVHHLDGHLFATELDHADAVPPFTALLVSGGHTLIIDVEAWGSYRLLGRTRDDAAGEAYDKVAKLLGLPYPGGPHVESLAATGGGTLRFSRPMLRRNQRPGDDDYYHLSFSGLKTAVLNEVRRETDPPPHADIARAFQDALVDTLVEKTARATAAYRRQRVVLGGGVAGNRTLVARMRDRLAADRIEVYAPSPRLATDNAAMIARAGAFRLLRGERSDLSLNAYASQPIPGMIQP